MVKARNLDDPVLAETLTPLGIIQLEDDFEIDDVVVDGGEVAGSSGRGGRFRFSLLRDVTFAAKRLDGATLTDVVLETVDLGTTNLTKASLHRVSFANCRCLGIGLAEAALLGVRFTSSSIELANFRFSKLERVTFINCAMTAVDFGNATLTDVVFKNCHLDKAIFSGARLRGVRLSGSALQGIQGIADLRGATITHDQLIELVPALAAELGIRLES